MQVPLPDPGAADAVLAAKGAAPHPFWGDAPADPLLPHALLVRLAWDARSRILEAFDKPAAEWPGDDDPQAIALSTLVARILASPTAPAMAIGMYWCAVEREVLGIHDGLPFPERGRAEQMSIFAVRGLVLGLSTRDAMALLAID